MKIYTGFEPEAINSLRGFNVKDNHQTAQKSFTGLGSVNGTHLAVIFSCALSLVAITFLKNGFKFELNKTLRPAKQITYAEVYNKVAAKYPEANSVYAESELQNKQQLALLDPDLGFNSQVAGISTGTLSSIDLPELSQIISEKELTKIPILLMTESNAQLLKNYQAQMADWDLQNLMTEVIVSLNSDDLETLKSVPPKVENISVLILRIPVPSVLEEYHKLTLLYYFELSMLAEGLANVPNAIDPKDTSLNIFSLLEKLGQIKSEMYNNYGLEL